MHGISAGLVILIVSCAVAVVRFWRIVLFLFLCAAVAAVLLGLVAVVGFFAH